MAVTALEITDLTTAVEPNSQVEGTGAFDALMNSVRASVYEEYREGRITGQEYAEVYLGATTSAMSLALDFLLKKDLIPLEAENLRLTGLRIEKESQKVDSEILLVNAQIDRMVKEADLIDKQIEKITAEISMVEDERENLQARTANEVLQGAVLEAQECKLRAEFDVLQQQKDKVASETVLLNQKRLTEAAQITGAGVDSDSVIGKQKELYGQQADGFKRDAEQKAAKLLLETWSVQRTTDDGIQASSSNGLQDSNLLRVVNKLLGGIEA